MDAEKSRNIIKKKKRIVILLFLFVLFTIILMLFVGMRTGSWLYGVVQNYNVSKSEDVNTLHIDASNDNEEDDVMVVEIDNNKNEANNERNNENNNTNTENPLTKPKVVDAPYYIKVNNEANVVTIYKKDSKRKVYSAF